MADSPGIMRALTLLVILALALWGGWRHWQGRPITTPSGRLAPDVPQQLPLRDQLPIRHGEYTLEPQAIWQGRARILMTERYYLDQGAALAPVDVALGWGQMSDTQVLADLELWQQGRFLFWRPRDVPVLTPDAIIRQATNVHVIAANALIAKRLGQLRPGQTVTFIGKLVNASHADGFTWRSSLSREDTGNGACELLYLEHLQID